MSVSGFLTSQVGYDLGDPKRAIIRSDRRDYVPDGATFHVLPAAAEDMHEASVLAGEVHYWGQTWNAHWWEIDFSDLEQAGEYVIVVRAPGVDGDTLHRSESVRIDDNILWQETVEPIAGEGSDHLRWLAFSARSGIAWDYGRLREEMDEATPEEPAG